MNCICSCFRITPLSQGVLQYNALDDSSMSFPARTSVL